MTIIAKRIVICYSIALIWGSLNHSRTEVVDRYVREALNAEWRHVMWLVVWINHRPPTGYEPGEVVDVTVFVSPRDNAVGICGEAFGRCSFYVKPQSDKIEYWHGWPLNSHCNDNCAELRFQKMYESYITYDSQIKRDGQRENSRGRVRYFDDMVLKSNRLDEDLPASSQFSARVIKWSIPYSEYIVDFEEAKASEHVIDRLVNRATEFAELLLGGDCGKSVKVKVPQITVGQRNVVVHVTFEGGCPNTAEIFSYSKGDWRKSLAINGDEEVRNMERLIDRQLLRELTVYSPWGNGKQGP